MDKVALGTAMVTLGAWSRSERSHAEGEPPHFLGGDLTDPRHPNELGIIWADEDHLEAVAVEDYDGCRAVVAK